MISTQFFPFFFSFSARSTSLFPTVGVEAFKDVKKILLDGASRPRKALYNAPPLKETGGILLISSVKEAEQVRDTQKHTETIGKSMISMSMSSSSLDKGCP